MNKFLCFITLAFCLVLFGFDGRGGFLCEYDVKSVTHVVERGETIWGIAEQYYHLEQKEKLSEFVWRVDRQNSKRRFIQPGDLIIVRYNVVRK